MRDNTGRILRIVCYALAALLLWQLGRAVIRSNPLRHVNVPALPSLPADTNAPPVAKGTNAVASQVSSKPGTNAPGREPVKVSSNAVPAIASAQVDSNSVASNAAPVKVATNTVVMESAGRVVINSTPPERVRVATNIVIRPGTEVDAAPMVVGATKVDTNLAAGKTDTNAAARVAARARASGPGAGPDAMTMAMNSSRPGRGGKPADLPPAIKARVDRIYDSEILGQVMRPLPMALLGIAGGSAFLRSPTGQTGMVKEGDQLGELKLLKIGINRVLVEQDGDKKELTIFSGTGGESLLPKPQESPK